ncbi:MAG: hypothetical protein K9M45_00270 [Kiritimatiellales bacterium]|nr:hypothetical protein [Kiritimatiellales bacterium]
MKTLIRQFISIARLTALEILRQPITILLLLSCLALISLLPLLITHKLGDSDRIVRDSALAVHFVSGLLLGGFAAASSLAREFRSGTVATILSKPVGRSLFFLSKFVGTAAVVLLFSTALTLATLMSTRAGAELFRVDWWAEAPLLLAPIMGCAGAGLINFHSNRSFPSTAFILILVFLTAGFLLSCVSGTYDLRIVPLGVLITLALLILASISVSLTTRLKPISTLAVCTAVFFAGLMSDYHFGRFATSSQVAAFLYGILPNWQNFWLVDGLSGTGSVTWNYVAHAALYSLLYLSGILALGLSAFRRLEVK